MHKISKIAQIACALEPIPHKEGCTSRYVDRWDSLKLEYFIISGINIGPIVEELITRVKSKGWPCTTYDLLLKATITSMDHRGGGRVNAGMIQFLWPFLIEAIINKPGEIWNLNHNIIDFTTPEDAVYIQAANNIGYMFWDQHLKKIKLIDRSFISVKDFYLNLAKSPNLSHYYHAKEFITCYPILNKLIQTFNTSGPFAENLSLTYHKVIKNTDIPPGIVADLCTCLIFLLLFYNDYTIT